MFTVYSGTCNLRHGIGKFGLSASWWTFDQERLAHLCRQIDDLQRDGIGDVAGTA